MLACATRAVRWLLPEPDHCSVDDKELRHFQRQKQREDWRDSRSWWPLRRVLPGYAGVLVPRRRAVPTARVVVAGWVWVSPAMALSIVPLVFDTPAVWASGEGPSSKRTVALRCKVASPSLAVTRVSNVEVAVLQQLRLALRNVGEELDELPSDQAVADELRSRLSGVLERWGVEIDSVLLV